MVNFYFFVQCMFRYRDYEDTIWAQLDLLWFLFSWAPVGLGGRWHQRVAGLADGLAGNRRHGGNLAALGTGEPPSDWGLHRDCKICIYILILIYLHCSYQVFRGNMTACPMLQSLKVWGHSETFAFEDKYYFPPPLHGWEGNKVCLFVVRFLCPSMGLVLTF